MRAAVMFVVFFRGSTCVSTQASSTLSVERRFPIVTSFRMSPPRLQPGGLSAFLERRSRTASSVLLLVTQCNALRVSSRLLV